MNNEEKILELLGAMQGQMSAMQSRQEHTEELLGAVQADIRDVTGRLTSVEEKLDGLREDVDELKDSSEEVRASVNTLIGWAERVSSMEAYNMPKL